MKFNYKWNLSDGYPAPGIDYHGSKVLSTFSCGGGSTMGYKLAGYDVIGANDIDPKMMEAYIANHHPKYSFIESISTFKDRELPEEFFDLDLLDGSPPCSSFSMAGNREKDWGKEKKFREGQSDQVLDTLFFDFIDLAKRLQPKVVVAENVKGLLLGDAIQYVRKIYDDFDKAGYYCQHWLLDASKMGVPQRRERVFFVCLRKDLADPFMYQKDMFTRMPKLELKFNENPIPFGNIEEKCENRNSIAESYMKYWYSANPADGRAKTKTGNTFGFLYRGYRHLVAATVVSNDNACTIEDEPLQMTDNELIKIGSFPGDYNFSKNTARYLIGMSVPPVMTAQIAHQIYSQWISKLEDI